jgi:hypothetical protein
VSWTTGTQTEALSAGNANGSAYSTSTTSTVISPATGAGYCPANFWLPSYGISKSLLVKASGVLSDTATPNLTLAVVANTTQGTPPATLTTGTAGVLATTGTVAQASGVTNIMWELDCIISNVTTGSSGTFLTMGVVKYYITPASAVQSARISSSSANPNTSATLSTQSAYYIELAALWGTNSSSNTIQCYAYTVLGLN